MTLRVRREPPRFRRVHVEATTRITTRLVRVTLAGDELAGFALAAPASSVRLLLPSPGTTELVMPAWNGNEFLLPDGSRPVIRTLTPRHADPRANTLDVEVVLHGDGAVSRWAEHVVPGAAAAVSGPGRGYDIPAGTSSFVLAGDETAIPAMCQLLEVLPHETPVEVTIEIARPDARFELPAHPHATVHWVDAEPGDAPGTRLVAAFREQTLAPDARVWVAGEAAAMQRIRNLLFDERGVPRAHATVRGYWKHGRRGDDD